MIGAVNNLKVGDKVKISKSFGGGSGVIENFNGDFAVVKTRKGYAQYGKSLLTKKSINGIGAFKLISIPKSEINKMTQGQIFVKIMNHEKKRTYTNVTFKNLVNRLSYLEAMDFKRYRKHSI